MLSNRDIDLTGKNLQSPFISFLLHVASFTTSLVARPEEVKLQQYESLFPRSQLNNWFAYYDNESIREY